MEGGGSWRAVDRGLWIDHGLLRSMEDGELRILGCRAVDLEPWAVGL